MLLTSYSGDQIDFLRACRANTFHGTDTRTVYRNKKDVATLMIKVTMRELKLTRREAKVRLSTVATFRSRTLQTGTVEFKPSHKLRAIIPHFMSDLKRVAARAFYEKFNALEQKKEGVYITGAYGKEIMNLTKQACLEILWDNAFFSTVRGCLCMLAALDAVLSKWDDINGFLVPVTVGNREPYYEVTSLKVSRRFCSIEFVRFHVAFHACWEEPLR